MTDAATAAISNTKADVIPRPESSSSRRSETNPSTASASTVASGTIRMRVNTRFRFMALNLCRHTPGVVPLGPLHHVALARSSEWEFGDIHDGCLMSVARHSAPSDAST